MNFIDYFSSYKQTSLSGRYITNKHIEPLLNNLKASFEVNILGYSVQQKPIHSIEIGSGEIKVFMWSQMHGNESTTTKALFDFFNFLQSNEELALKIKKNFSLFIIPILNPDGAEMYTRENANNVDLNRDSVDLSQPEAQLLRKTFEKINPNFCFNLHDQRTIYAAGETSNPATVSFLAPAYNEDREYNENRLKAVEIIVAMNNELQKHIPNQVGRFDDSFNENCIGDTFQKLQVPTILFEAGHYQNDYEREETRKFIFISYLTALNKIYENVIVNNFLDEYLRIPQNKIRFYDFIYKNIKIKAQSLDLITNFAAQYVEVLSDNTIQFQAQIAEIGINGDKIGHKEYDGNGGIFSDTYGNTPEIDNIANFKVNEIEFIN